MKKLIYLVVILILGIAAYFGFIFYNTFIKSNISDQQKFVYIKTNSDLDSLIQNLETNQIIEDISTFKKAAASMGLAQKIKPGRYALKDGMNNRALINLIKSGNQTPLDLKIHNLRTLNDLSSFISNKLECDSTKLMNYLQSDFLPNHPEFDKDNLYTLFIPNTYEIYWNTSASDFVTKMYDEHQKFWNKNRIALADSLKLSTQKVTILASIVDAEALYDKEMPKIAGLYINRLKKGIKLQADPTVIFAHQDFSIRRVTNRLLTLASPYNTYYVTGLPPGPIMMPSINAIDAVLNYERNNYIYMCAKEDFSGYHNFANTKAEHLVNAKLFQKALDVRNIKR